MYNKLFTKILDSSIWLEPTPTRIVWLTLIAVMDESGFAQFASVANVAHRAIVTLDEAQAAITVLETPDPNSSDPENEGKRIERVPGGWMVLNAGKHRDLVTRAVIKEQTRDRVKRFRERLKRASNASVTTSDTDTEATTRAEAEERKTGERGNGNGNAASHSKSQPSPTEQNGPAPIFGRTNPHKNHACCGRVCLHSTQFEQFTQLAGNHVDPDAYVRQFFAGWDDRYVKGDRQTETIGEDGFNFWRNRWAETHPTKKSRAKVEDVEARTSQERQRAEIAKGEARRKSVGL